MEKYAAASVRTVKYMTCVHLHGMRLFVGCREGSTLAPGLCCFFSTVCVTVTVSSTVHNSTSIHEANCLVNPHQTPAVLSALLFDPQIRKLCGGQLPSLADMSAFLDSVRQRVLAPKEDPPVVTKAIVTPVQRSYFPGVAARIASEARRDAAQAVIAGAWRLTQLRRAAVAERVRLAAAAAAAAAAAGGGGGAAAAVAAAADASCVTNADDTAAATAAPAVSSAKGACAPEDVKRRLDDSDKDSASPKARKDRPSVGK